MSKKPADDGTNPAEDPPKITRRTKRRAIVTPAGGEPVEVEVPADHPAPESVAVVAYRKKADAWTDDRKLSVTFPDDEA